MATKKRKKATRKATGSFQSKVSRNKSVKAAKSRVEKIKRSLKAAMKKSIATRKKVSKMLAKKK
jgi:hypothetical protein